MRTRTVVLFKVEKAMFKNYSGDPLRIFMGRSAEIGSAVNSIGEKSKEKGVLFLAFFKKFSETLCFGKIILNFTCNRKNYKEARRAPFSKTAEIVRFRNLLGKKKVFFSA